MKPHALAFERVPALSDNLRETLIEGIAEADVTHEASFEKGERSDAFGPIDDLVRQQEVARLDLLLQAAHGREGDYRGYADFAESGDVRATRHLVRSEFVVHAMPTDESDGNGLAG